MKTIKVKKISLENFKKYGEFCDLYHPQTFGIGVDSSSAFYPDALTLQLGNQHDASICVCHIKKRENIIENYEFHNNCCEGIFPIDADCVIFAGLGFGPFPCKEFEAFLVPAGTFIKLKAGVLHGTQFVVDKNEATIMVVLPERTFATDMNMCILDDEDKMKVVF